MFLDCEKKEKEESYEGILHILRSVRKWCGDIAQLEYCTLSSEGIWNIILFYRLE